MIGIDEMAAGEDLLTAKRADPVEAFGLWLDQTTEGELEKAEPELEEKALSCHRSGRAWRLAMGEAMYKHREVVNKRGSRDWTKWVTETLGVARTTAYDLIRGWLEEHGHGLESRSEEDQPNPQAEAIEQAIAEQVAKRKGLSRAPSSPQLDIHVKISWPETFVTREERNQFQEERQRDPNRVYQICLAAIHAVIATPSLSKKPSDY